MANQTKICSLAIVQDDATYWKSLLSYVFVQAWKLINEFIEKGSIEFSKLVKTKKNIKAEDLKKEILMIINTRNKNNLFE